jgi:7-cyano-7-deazaguanine synthase
LDRIAVLASGGLDSSVLVADLARTHEVFPVYVEAGLAWEKMERRALDAYLGALPGTNIHKLTVLQLPVRSLYGEHWSTTGENVPDAEAPDIDVYLPGRNVLLLGLTSVWCALNDVHEVAIGSLDDNPFPDATPEFFADYSKVLSASLSHEIVISAPYRQRHKSAIIAEFPNLPLELTLTCMSPQLDDGGLVHCGACNKCNERQVAFRDAGVADRTRYAT